MLNVRNLLKENCTYKLFLIDMIEHFEDMKGKASSSEMVQYFRQLKCLFEEVLELKEKTNPEQMKKLMEDLCRKNEK